METPVDCSNMGFGDDEDSAGYGSEMDVEPSVGESETMPESTESGIDPYEGMEFETDEDAWTIYNNYARRAGFTTRISFFHRSRKDGSITSRQFVCAREGFRVRSAGKDERSDGGKSKRTRAVTRVGCKAMIRLKKQENGRWVVSNLHTEHNHEMVSPSRANSIRSHRLLSECARNPVNSSLLVSERAREVNIMDYTSISSETINWGGLEFILDYLQRMQAEDSSFFYAVQSDGVRCTGNVFWSDQSSRTSYKHSGDVVVIDSSYKKKQYQVPFVSFTGINHHGDPVLFGCALLVDDSELSFIWLFQTLLQAMSGSHPVSIISEQDWTIQAAVVQVFPQTRHRLCKWHILNEGRDKLPHIYISDPSFKEEFYKCINMTETVDEFESCWEILIGRFDLRFNEWLQSVYSCRHYWVPVHLKSAFFAEISPTEHCETSSFFEGFIDAQTGPQMFIQQYEKALVSWHEKEVKADLDAAYTLPVLKTPSPMEKQVSEVYTRRLFREFQEELIETSAYAPKKISDEGEIHTYKVARLGEEHEACNTVMFDASEIKATCSCQMFEYSGILCRHILTVFRVTSVDTIPSHYILKRWTKIVSNAGVSEINNGVTSDEAKSLSSSQDHRESLTWRYKSLHHEAMKFVEDGSTSLSIYNVAICALQEALKKVATAKNNARKSSHGGTLPNGTVKEENGDKGIQASTEKRTVNAQFLGIEQMLPSQQIRQATAEELLLLQPPLKFVLVSPGSSSETRSLEIITALDPSDINKPDGQPLSTFYDGQQEFKSLQDVNAPVSLAVKKQSFPEGHGLIDSSIPSINISNEDPKNSQPSQCWGLTRIDQANDDLGGSSSSGFIKGLSPRSSETQFVAVPLSFYVPMNDTPSTGPALAKTSEAKTVASPVPTPPITPCDLLRSQAPSRSQLDNRRVAAKFPVRLAKKKALHENLIPENQSPLRAAAIAAGAHVIPVSAATSFLRAVQTKSVIHVRNGRYSRTNLQPPAVLNPYVTMSPVVALGADLDRTPKTGAEAGESGIGTGVDARAGDGLGKDISVVDCEGAC